MTETLFAMNDGTAGTGSFMLLMLFGVGLFLSIMAILMPVYIYLIYKTISRMEKRMDLILQHLNYQSEELENRKS